jgi:hypothetical protein
MTCPVCGLVSPEEAAMCDCGFSFATRSGGARPAVWKRYRSVWPVAGYLTVLLLFLALVLWAFTSGPSWQG